MRTRSSWIRPPAVGLILALGFVTAAPPALAATHPAAPTRPSTLAASAEARVAASDLAAQTTAAPAGGESSTNLFKSRKGVVVLVLLAGVVTWTVVSRSRDAIHSPGRN